MSAEIVYLAQWKADHAVQVRFTLDPLVFFRAWAGFWMTGTRK